MAPTEIPLIVFACAFAGALLGIFLRGRIPKHRLSAGTENVIKLGMGLIATARSSCETQFDGLMKVSSAPLRALIELSR